MGFSAPELPKSSDAGDSALGTIENVGQKMRGAAGAPNPAQILNNQLYLNALAESLRETGMTRLCARRYYPAGPLKGEAIS